LVPVGAVVAVVGIRKSVRMFRLPKLSRAILPLACLAIVFGYGLRIFTLDSQLGSLGGSAATTVETVAWILAIPLYGLMGARAITTLGVRVSLFAISGSALVGSVLYYGPYHPLSEYWKFVIGYGVILLLLNLVQNNRMATVGIAVPLIAVCVSQSARSLALQLAFAVAVSVFARESRKSPVGQRSIRRLTFITVLASGVAYSLAQAMRAGLFGPALERTYMLQTAGNRLLIFGGRPELAATRELFTSHVFGFGLAVHPAPMFEADAIAAVTAAGSNVFGDYYSNSVFGPRVDLHSMIATLWFHTGLVGLLFGAVIGGLLIRGVIVASSTKGFTGAAPQFLIATALWNLAFSPMANIDALGVGIAVAIAALHEQAVTSPPAPTVMRSTFDSPLAAVEIADFTRR
jgi:hypothetical protein